MSRTLNKVTKESLEKTPFEKRGVSCDQELSRVPLNKLKCLSQKNRKAIFYECFPWFFVVSKG